MDAILKKMKEKEPSLSENLSDAVSGRILTPIGVNKIIEGLKSQGKIQRPEDGLVLCKAIENKEKIKDEISSTLLQLAEAPDGSRAALIFNTGANDMHLSPLLFEKRGGKIRIANLDSVGENEMYRALTAMKITMALKDMELEGLDIELYEVSFSRQRDSVNCPIFSIRDVVAFSKQEDFFSIVECEDSEGLEGISACYKITSLPPSIMKVTQSLSQLEEYIERNDATDGIIHRHRRKVGCDEAIEEIEETLQQNVERHCFYSVDDRGDSKLRNMLIQNRFNKYLGILVRETLRESTAQ
jgi:hypothetical protein